MYSCDELFMRLLETLSWVHKQFATRVHTLFYINRLITLDYDARYKWRWCYH